MSGDKQKLGYQELELLRRAFISMWTVQREVCRGHWVKAVFATSGLKILNIVFDHTLYFWKSIRAPLSKILRDGRS